MSSKVKTAGSLILLCVVVLAVWFAQPNKPLLWTVANVNTDVLSGDAHLLRLPNGDNWLIDAGYRDFAYGRLLPGIHHHNVTRLKGVIITHAHRNHYGGLYALVESDIEIDSVFFNAPNREQCDRERAGGRCLIEHVNATFEMLADNNIPVRPISEDSVFFDHINLKLSLKTLYQFPARSAPFGNGTINDTSPVMKLIYGNTSALFAGDLGAAPGGYLADVGENLDADFFVVPHHGVRVTTPNRFFDRVNAKTALVSGPYATFNGPRGEQVRQYYGSKNIPLRVAGIEGALTVKFDERGFEHSSISVSPEFSAN
ncbi:MAG: hypothetical protein AAF402_12830 [Pseudomonadota bacterium]